MASPVGWSNWKGWLMWLDWISYLISYPPSLNTNYTTVRNKPVWSTTMLQVPPCRGGTWILNWRGGVGSFHTAHFSVEDFARYLPSPWEDAMFCPRIIVFAFSSLSFAIESSLGLSHFFSAFKLGILIRIMSKKTLLKLVAYNIKWSGRHFLKA